MWTENSGLTAAWRSTVIHDCHSALYRRGHMPPASGLLALSTTDAMLGGGVTPLKAYVTGVALTDLHPDAMEPLSYSSAH